MIEIYFCTEGTQPRLRRWVDELAAALAKTGRVRHSLPERDDGESHFQTVYVDVFGVESEVEALEHVQPLLRALVDWDILRGGTSVMQLVVPTPPV